ncbi:MAG TPA: hypothetical protein VLF63_01815 [Patescibacteria group bacterium]|nr:hypothetical protein [Patescibacteria group bacterium]
MSNYIEKSPIKIENWSKMIGSEAVRFAFGGDEFSVETKPDDSGNSTLNMILPRLVLLDTYP